MPKVNATVTVPASPSRTWAVASDLTRFDEWMTLHDGWRGELPAEIAKGTSLTSVVKVMGLRNRVSWQVDSYTPPSAMRIRGRGVGGVHVALTLAIQESGAGSTVTVDAEVTGRPVFGPVGMAIGRAVRADVRRSVAALADLVR
ncbi:SRPBCC family protein [Actinophytocola glycyrrhizae]|uniref:SRPBCC family protein n=1 Tax=Actinophytocola glycyrrhizae TaxID=2044873 RepID=A0ABV9S9W0_9PSEU